MASVIDVGQRHIKQRNARLTNQSREEIATSRDISQPSVSLPQKPASHKRISKASYGTTYSPGQLTGLCGENNTPFQLLCTPDRGATQSIMAEDTAIRQGLHIDNNNKVPLVTANRQPMSVNGTTEEGTHIVQTIDSCRHASRAGQARQ